MIRPRRVAEVASVAEAVRGHRQQGRTEWDFWNFWELHARPELAPLLLAEADCALAEETGASPIASCEAPVDHGSSDRQEDTPKALHSLAEAHDRISSRALVEPFRRPESWEDWSPG